MKVKRALAVLLLIVFTMVMCTGCIGGSTKHVKFSATDGTEVKIDYVKTGALVRTAHFKTSTNGVTMYFNGNDWYRAEIIECGSDREVMDKITEEPMAVSTNIKVYDASDIGYNYIYVLDLENCETCYIAFFTEQSPENSGYGNDFETNIKFFSGKTETVPDCNWVIQ